MALIYKATNDINGKIYVGKTTLTLEQRRKKHQAVRLAPRQVFQKALVKYGFHNFQWCVLEEVAPENLNKAEVRWIATLNSTNPSVGYNRTPGGDGGVRGAKDSDETRKKKSIGMLGNQNASRKTDTPRKSLSPEHRAALSNAMKGKNLGPRPQAVKDAISKTMSGRTLSLETRQRIAEGAQGAWAGRRKA